MYEKESAISNPMMFFEGTHGKLLFKLLATYLSNTELHNELSNITEDTLSDPNKMEPYARKMIEFMVLYNPQNRTYTTGQLATFFKVSVTTINNWIRSGRFFGLTSKAKNKQARVTENVLWQSPTGELFPIKEVVRKYYKDLRVQENKVIESSIEFFERKYQGPYHAVLQYKAFKTEEELRDEEEWRYLLSKRDEYK